MANKILELKKIGCDFGGEISDVLNYRVRTLGECVQGKDGRTYFLEFMGGHPSYTYRQENKRTGEKLKKPVKELRNANALFLETEYTHNDGLMKRSLNYESLIYDMNLSYTLENILKVVNMISTDNYTEIVFIN